MPKKTKAYFCFDKVSSPGRPQVVICHQSGVFQGLFGDKTLGRFATKKVAIFEFLEKGWKSGDFEIEIGEKWLF